MLFNMFGQLCYYQSTNLVTVPAKLPTTLLTASKFVTLDMYDNLGKWCTASQFDVTGLVNIQGELIPRSIPNCTDSVVIISPQVSFCMWFEETFT